MKSEVYKIKVDTADELLASKLSSSFSFSLQGKAPKESRAILTEILACFLPGWAKDLSAPLYVVAVIF